MMFVFSLCLFSMCIRADHVTPLKDNIFRAHKQETFSPLQYHKSLRADQQTAPDVRPEVAVEKDHVTRDDTVAQSSIDAGVYGKDAMHREADSPHFLVQTSPEVDDIFFSGNDRQTSSRDAPISKAQSAPTLLTVGGQKGAGGDNEERENAADGWWHGNSEPTEKSSTLLVSTEDTSVRQKKVKVSSGRTDNPRNAADAARLDHIKLMEVGGTAKDETSALKKEKRRADVDSESPENGPDGDGVDDIGLKEEGGTAQADGEETSALKNDEVVDAEKEALGNAGDDQDIDDIGLKEDGASTQEDSEESNARWRGEKADIAAQHGVDEQKKESGVAKVGEEKKNARSAVMADVPREEPPSTPRGMRGGDPRVNSLENIVKGIQSLHLPGRQVHLNFSKRVKEFSSFAYKQAVHSLPTRATQISASVALSFGFFCLCLCVIFFKNCRHLEDSALTIIYVLTFGCALVSAKCAFVNGNSCPVSCALLQTLAMAASWVGMRRLEGKQPCWNEEQFKELIKDCWPYGLCIGASMVLINVAMYHMSLLGVAALLLFSPLSKTVLSAIVKNEDIKADVLGCVLFGFVGCTIVVLTGQDVGLPVAICMLSIMLGNLEKHIRLSERDHRFDVSILLSSGFTFVVWIFTGDHQFGVPSMHPYLWLTFSCFATSIYVGSQITLKKAVMGHSAHLACCGLLFLCSRFILFEQVAFLQVLGIIVVLAANLWCRSISLSRSIARLKGISKAKGQLL